MCVCICRYVSMYALLYVCVCELSVCVCEIQGFDDVAAVNDKQNQMIAYYFVGLTWRTPIYVCTHVYMYVCVSLPVELIVSIALGHLKRPICCVRFELISQHICHSPRFGGKHTRTYRHTHAC